MDRVPIEVERLKAGEAYLAALRRLGLEPEGLFWAWDLLDNELILILVSRYFDAVGPLALSELLFKAHRADAMPAEIDPFSVRLHSPDHHMIRTIIDVLDKFKEQVVDTGREASMKDGVLENGSIAIPLSNIYRLRDVRRPSIDLLRKWNVIERKVDALAA
jgi:hypothetical protein